MKRLLLLAILLMFVLSACAPALPGDGATISWQAAISLLNDGQVTMVFQAHSLEVTMTLKNGATVKTLEPYIDAIFEEIQACGAPCAGIAQATE